MLIKKKRIRSVKGNIRGFRRGDQLVVCVKNPERFINSLVSFGFSSELVLGQTVLPASVGPVSRFNAEGKYLVHKDKPMETAYRQAEWKWQEFRGRYDTVEMSKIVDIPYSRHPRTLINPPSVELSVLTDKDGKKCVAAPRITFTEQNDEHLIHVVNLFLELFGECELLREDMSSTYPAKIIRLNWEVLPKGAMPWEKLHAHLRPILDRQPDGNRVVIEKRHEAINTHEPDFVAVGRGGFDGYVIFGFPSRSLYILESTQVNNATYALDRNWEELSGLTKAQLLNEKLHKARLVHRENWFAELNRLLSR